MANKIRSENEEQQQDKNSWVVTTYITNTAARHG
jgi:hypothetical protein